ncbi:MAG TPA: radical SAM protein [Methylomirabilota bacterium]|jgi:MoaA/NifB/PqqE/SkfB family radical SAM enzyme
MTTRALPVIDPVRSAPTAPFLGLSALWIQITGTWCNLECRHCINASGPRAPWLKPLDGATVRGALAEAETVGVKEIYFTGGEPFLHGEIVPLLERALEIAPTTVLTNGTLIGPEQAEALAALAARARYSLEIRVSLDDTDRALNDQVRGEGAWAKAVAAVRHMRARGLLPIVTATEITREAHGPGPGMYERFRDFLRAQGVDRPRVKIMPVFGLGRQSASDEPPLTEDDLEGFDRSVLQCADARVVTATGVYACPILAGLEGARLSNGGLAESFVAAPLYHPACVTCRRTGMTCRNS